MALRPRPLLFSKDYKQAGRLLWETSLHSAYLVGHNSVNERHTGLSHRRRFVKGLQKWHSPALATP